VIEDHLSWFPDTRLIIISNSQWIGDEQPCLTYGMRGMLCATVRVDGGDRNLHSGNDGGVFNEPMADLVRLLATLVDSQHNILVPGFYDDVNERLLAPALDGIKVRPRVDHCFTQPGIASLVHVLSCMSRMLCRSSRAAIASNRL
jgi:acetylornithine deacetylase/succinyl-diaminopimelate desuccinylase-like protein